MPLSIGPMRHWILIQAPTDEKNSLGEGEQSYRTIAECWARVEPVSGREYFSASRVVTEASHKVTCRWLAGVDASCVVLLGGRWFDISFVEDVEGRGEVLRLWCLEYSWHDVQ